MSRIRDSLRKAVDQNRIGFIPFITAGDPSTGATLDLLGMLAKNGADVIELGVPFSDPVADGPVIQASAQRALENSEMNVAGTIEIVRKFREKFDTPILLFGYLNPFLSYGFEQFAIDASEAGVDGVLITDVVDEEYSEFRQILSNSYLDLIPLIAPTTTAKRVESIVADATGFVYVISMTGVTGSKAVKGNEVEDLVNTIRNHTDVPIAVGFGISDSESFGRVGRYADAAVVGSAIVKRIAEAKSEQEAVSLANDFVSELLS